MARHLDVPARVAAVHRVDGARLCRPALYRAVHLVADLQRLRRGGGRAVPVLRRAGRRPQRRHARDGAAGHRARVRRRDRARRGRVARG